MEEREISVIRPYKWSSWDCEIWYKDNKKVFLWSEQKWADIGIEGEYSLVPMAYHDDFKEVNPKHFMMNDKDETDLIFVIDGDSHTIEASDCYETADFGNHKDLEDEYNNVVEGYNAKDEHPYPHEILDELGYEQTFGYHVVKLYQRKLGE